VFVHILRSRKLYCLISISVRSRMS